MPKLLKDDTVLEQRSLDGGAFTFRAARIDKLGATEYTLVTIAVDVTGSTYAFSDQLREALVSAVEACQRSPFVDRLLLRVVTFSTAAGGVREIHGFVPLADVDVAGYPVFEPDGLTPLYDAVYASVGAMAQYAEDLYNEDYLSNGIVIVITDGLDNVSQVTPAMIKENISEIRRKERMESLVTILVGINAEEYRGELEAFRRNVGIDYYVDAGQASDTTLARLAQFVSRSVVAQSQALGSGAPSQAISATI